MGSTMPSRRCTMDSRSSSPWRKLPKCIKKQNKINRNINLHLKMMGTGCIDGLLDFCLIFFSLEFSPIDVNSVFFFLVKKRTGELVMECHIYPPHQPVSTMVSSHLVLCIGSSCI